MRKTAATLTLALPSQMSSSTTTHTTGVALMAERGTLASSRTTRLARDAAASASA